MAFEEWLALGGNEIINNARTVGYAKTASCPMGWFKIRPCDTLLAATLIGAFARDDVQSVEGEGTSTDYRATAIQGAPWYDPILPDVSGRFYGAFGLSVTGIEDSTREAGVTQNLGDGGVIGRVRKAPREVRVVALLAGEGQDALEYGMGWLNAALDPNACGQHGDACGTADLAFFSTCPPPRKQNPTYSEPQLIATNLVKNPSMETPTAALTLFRTNHMLTPRLDDSAGSWVAGDSTLTPAPGGLQVDLLGTGPALAAQHDAPPVAAPDETWTGSVEVEVPLGYPALTLALGVEAVGTETTFDGAPVTIQPGELVRISATAKMPAGTTAARLVISTAATHEPSARFLMRLALLEEEAAVLPYFDGSTFSENGYTYAWTGAVDASPSTQSTVGVLHWSGSDLRLVHQSANPGFASIGEHSLHAVSFDGANGDVRLAGSGLSSFPDGVVAGTEYTMTADLYIPAPHSENDESGTSRQRRIIVIYSTDDGATKVELFGPQAPNVAGWHTVTHTFFLPADATGAVIGLGSAGSASAGVDPYFESYWDAVALVSGQSLYDYFDGDTADTTTETYEWTGTPHDSTSTLVGVTFIGNVPEDNEAYRLELNKVRRYLHDVAAVSGPLIQAEFQSGRHWAYQVEFTLVAANPYVFGVRRELDLPPRLPSVISDIPYNLVLHPSAELPNGTVVVATNFAPNPSLEVDAAGWLTWYNANIPPAMQGSSRTSDLAAHGSWAYEGRVTGDNGATPITDLASDATNLQVPFPLTGLPAGTRVSFSIWSAMINLGGVGGTTLNNMSAAVHWLDAADAIITSEPLGAGVSGAALNGQVFSGKSLLPPPGTVKVRVAVMYSFSFSSSANASDNSDIRLYSDALAVTVP
jgi:hypothetical protein